MKFTSTNKHAALAVMLDAALQKIDKRILNKIDEAVVVRDRRDRSPWYVKAFDVQTLGKLNGLLEEIDCLKDIYQTLDRINLLLAKIGDDKDSTIVLNNYECELLARYA